MLDIPTIINDIKNGSEKSFNLLYDLWISRLYRFVYQYIKSEIITDDIVQETFCQLWNNRKGLDPTKSIQAYIFTTSYHLIIKELRRQVNNPLLSEYIEYQENFTTADNETTKHMEFDQFQQTFELAKGKLTPRQREIFDLNKENSLSVKEIAEKLSISEQVVRNQLSAASRSIRKNLKPFNTLPFILFINYLNQI